MRPFVLSLGACILLLGTAWAQSSGGSGQQLPVGQTFKNFEFPLYQDGKLKATITAIEAKGVTLNRAETTELKIAIYDNGAITTTVTSPKADLYVNEQKMRTKDTVLIQRADMEASGQSCDFDLKTKQYMLRTNVKVVLKNFDASTKTKSEDTTTAPAATTTPPTPATTATPLFGPISPSAPRTSDSMLDSPGSYSNTNSAPTTPSTP